MPETTNYLRAWRDHLGLTLEQVGDRAGTSFQNIQRWEKGKRQPRLANRKIHLDALGITEAQALCPPPAGAKPEEDISSEPSAMDVEHVLAQMLRQWTVALERQVKALEEIAAVVKRIERAQPQPAHERARAAKN